MRKSHLRLLICALLPVLLVSCTAPSTPTAAPTSTPTATPTPIATVTPTPVPTPAPTPWPGLPTYNQEDRPYAETVLEIPAVYDMDEYDFSNEIQAITYRGADYKDKETRVFAYVGIPKTASAENPVPAVVLVHGGGHTADCHWVKYWVDRGYAAISMDLEGHYGISNGSYCVPTTESHAYSGPVRNGAFGDAGMKDITRQWPYQAVSAIMIARTLIGSYDVVDDSRVGIVGFSWGGYLTSFTISVDNRYAFAAPIYGSAYLKENYTFQGKKLTKAQQKWDPAINVENIASAKVLWINSDKDFFTNAIGNTLSYENVKDSVLVLDPNYSHGGGNAFSRPEVFTFADSVVFGKPGLIEFTSQPEGFNPTASFTVPDGVTPVSAKVFYRTEEMGFTNKEGNAWLSADAVLDTANNTVSATLPADTVCYYINVYDDRVERDQFININVTMSSTTKVVYLVDTGLN